MKILVVGLFRDEHKRIEKKLRNNRTVSVVFAIARHNHAIPRGDFDYCIVPVRYVSHEHTKEAHNLYGKKCLLVTGSSSAIFNKIEELTGV